MNEPARSLAPNDSAKHIFLDELSEHLRLNQWGPSLFAAFSKAGQPVKQRSNFA